MTRLRRPTPTNRILHLSIAAVTRGERVESHTGFFGSACFINLRDDIVSGFLLTSRLNDDLLGVLIVEFKPSIQNCNYQERSRKHSRILYGFSGHGSKYLKKLEPPAGVEPATY